MTGFIRGLFTRKNKQPRAPQPPKPTGAFFLSEDDAKSFGNIEYMRSSKVVRRTFARKKGQTEEFESIKQVSALDARALSEKGLPAPREAKPVNSFESPKASEPGQFQRRTAKVDTSMDMFRNMAKDLKKK